MGGEKYEATFLKKTLNNCYKSNGKIFTTRMKMAMQPKKYLRENIVRNHGMAKSSGMNAISCKWFASSGSWNAMIWVNLAKYSLITAELSFRKNLCKYFGTNADKHANAFAEK